VFANIDETIKLVLKKTPKFIPGCISCKQYAEDVPILTIDSIVICQTHAEDLRPIALKMHLGIYRFTNKSPQPNANWSVILQLGKGILSTMGNCRTFLH
jgi:hypothetical protein